MGHKSTDTLKEISDGIIKGTVDREKIWCVQTPQAFIKKAIIKAYELAEKQSYRSTDDSSLLENAGYQVKIINDSSINFKICSCMDYILQ